MTDRYMRSHTACQELGRLIAKTAISTRRMLVDPASRHLMCILIIYTSLDDFRTREPPLIHRHHNVRDESYEAEVDAAREDLDRHLVVVEQLDQLRRLR